MLVTITGERLPEAEPRPEVPEPPVEIATVGSEAATDGGDKKRTVAGMWVYVLVAGLFALFAILAGSGL